MESKSEYAETTPSYIPPPSTQYATSYTTTAPTPGATSYPAPGHPPTSENPTPAVDHSPYGKHYGYDQSPAGYPPQQGRGTPESLQQQQNVIMVGAGQRQQVIVQQAQSFIGHILLSCCVCWFCCLPLGLVAFILSLVASDTAVSDPESARKLGRVSIGLSITAIGLGIICWVLLLELYPSDRCTGSHC